MGAASEGGREGMMQGMDDDTRVFGGDLDNWTTPPWAVEAILPMLPYNRHGYTTVDPGAGTGEVTLAAHRAGLCITKALAVEVHPGRALSCKTKFAEFLPQPHSVITHDWLMLDHDVIAEWADGGDDDETTTLVLGNPPYTKPDPTVGLRFIEKSIAVANGTGVVALLLPLDFAAGVERAERVHDRWPCSCYPLRRRPSFGSIGNSTGGKRPIAWFVWDLLRKSRDFKVL